MFRIVVAVCERFFFRRDCIVAGLDVSELDEILKNHVLMQKMVGFPVYDLIV